LGGRTISLSAGPRPHPRGRRVRGGVSGTPDAGVKGKGAAVTMVRVDHETGATRN